MDDEEIEKIADSYARRQTSHKGGRIVRENLPLKFNVRQKDEDEPDEDMEEEEIDDEMPRKRGRPEGSGRKIVDFEE